MLNIFGMMPSNVYSGGCLQDSGSCGRATPSGHSEAILCTASVGGKNIMQLYRFASSPVPAAVLNSAKENIEEQVPQYLRRKKGWP